MEPYGVTLAVDHYYTPEKPFFRVSPIHAKVYQEVAMADIKRLEANNVEDKLVPILHSLPRPS